MDEYPKDAYGVYEPPPSDPPDPWDEVDGFFTCLECESVVDWDGWSHLNDMCLECSKEAKRKEPFGDIVQAIEELEKSPETALPD